MKKKIIILAFSVWSCQAVMGQSSCTAPVVPNAKPKNELAASYPTGSFIGYVCDSGYEFVETHYALCEDGTWNLPVCKLQTSCTVPFVPNAKLADEFTAALYPTGSSVQFVCDRGSEFEGTKYALCKDGTWKLPVCKILDHAPCASPHVPNARPADALAESYPSGSSVRFGCDGGYEFEGTDSAQCEDGVWTLPVCKDVKSCLAPSVPNGQPANALKTLYGPGETLRFVCDSGYEFEGTRYAVCDDGSWRLPVCKDVKSCLAPSVPNGQPANALKTLYGPGETLRFVCDSGYEFEGTRYAVCDDGSWRLPVCKVLDAACAAPHVPNAKPENELAASYPAGSSVRFGCDGGYEIEGTRYALCEDGTWRLPVCTRQKLCGTPSVPNARPTVGLSTSYSTGSYVSFKCNSGYEFVGEHYAKCVDGNWELPVCKSRDETVCSAPHVPNARPVVDLTLFYATGRTVRFVCDSGYEFEGTDTARCEGGIWSLPVCKGRGPHGGSLHPDPDAVLLPVRNCGTQPLIENGDVTELAGGNELKAQCKRLYKLTGPGTIRCVNGKWTEIPVCKPPCKLDRTKILRTYHPDKYLQEGETKRFYCSNTYQIDISCIDETPVYGECKCILCFIETPSTNLLTENFTISTATYIRGK
ncbi:complement factor H isoform X6 [Ictalurus punctatus]|uniref:Complement factor H isoform X6 n=1 Tax=Ictalurus punctatus TaxID=7998 RepID=A0A9F7R7V3_ICTPU|nr:complement factor H isoform X6 [Ictalurus punctatus]